MKLKPENLVCTPEQAAELKKLGIKQSSIFYYDMDFLHNEGTKGLLFVNIDQEYSRAVPNFMARPESRSNEDWRGWAAAFTVAELLDVVMAIDEEVDTFNPPDDFVKKYEAQLEAEDPRLAHNPEYCAELIIQMIKAGSITADRINKLI